MIYSNTNGFEGISVIGPIPYADHSASIWVGILSSGQVIDGDFKDWPGWDEGLENTLTKIADVVERAVKPKGLLVFGCEHNHNTKAAIARGEVLEDWDVKMEMYKLVEMMQ